MSDNGGLHVSGQEFDNEVNYMYLGRRGRRPREGGTGCEHQLRILISDTFLFFIRILLHILLYSIIFN